MAETLEKKRTQNGGTSFWKKGEKANYGSVE